MKIEELTPEYIFNKLQENHTSKLIREIDLSVGGKDIRIIYKRRGRGFLCCYLMEKVSTNPKIEWFDFQFMDGAWSCPKDFKCLFDGRPVKDVLKNKKLRRHMSELYFRIIICHLKGEVYTDRGNYIDKDSYYKVLDDLGLDKHLYPHWGRIEK